MQNREIVRKRLLPGITVGDMRRWLIYRPLAVLLVILLAPIASWMEGGSGHQARPFQASAQTFYCTSNCIIRNDPIGQYSLDVLQLEYDAVNAYLGIHNLPVSDAHIVYDYGRQDLRDAVRAVMIEILVGIINEPASQRTTHQQNLFNWLQGIVYNNEVNLYKLAIGQYQFFLTNECEFKLDPTIASVYGLTYNGLSWCYPFEASLFSPPVPAPSYFTAYGLKHAYLGAEDKDPNYAALYSDSTISTGEIWGIGLAAGAVAGAITAGSIAGALVPAEALWASYAVGSIALNATGAVNSGFLLSGSVTATTSAYAGAIAGPAVMVAICVIIGIVAGMELANNQKELNELNGLSATLAQVTANTQPDLMAMANDSTGNGLYKLQNSLFSQTDPDLPSNTPLPAHQSTDLNFAIAPQTASATQYISTLQYRDWNNNIWSAETSGGWFVRTCAQSPTSTASCQPATSIIGSLRYLDWSGVQWTAVRVGSYFVAVKAQVASTDQTCPPDPVAGVSLAPNLSQCISYTTKTLPMQDENGNFITVALTSLSAPSFNNPGPLSFSLGTAATKTITASGNPPPKIVVWQSALPPQFKFNLVNGASLPLSFNGSLTAPTGTYAMTLTATNSVGFVSQQINVSLEDVLNIVSSGTVTGTAGEPLSFTVVATGNPTPKLSLNAGNFDLTGLTFKDNGDGTGTLSGTYTGSSNQQQCFSNVPGTCGGFIATNSQGTVDQPLSLNLNSSPRAYQGAPANASFVAGIANSVLLTSYGSATPVSWLYQADPKAPWLQLKDNGNGTATLSGKPPISVSGTFQPQTVPYAVGSGGLVTYQAFQVTVSNAPVFISPNNAAFTVGTDGTAQINDNTGTVSTNSTLPSGLLLFNGSTVSCLFCTASISGTPAVGTGGQYTIYLTANASTGTGDQTLLLDVYEAPAFTSPNLAVLFAGQPASFNVTTKGYPDLGTQSVSANAGPPASPGDGTGPYFSVSGLPGSLQASNFNGQSQRTGSLTISGTPGAADVGTHKVQISVQNGVGSPVQQTFTLQVLPYSPATPVDLLSAWTLSRDANDNVIVALVVSNNGSAAAQKVTLSSAKIGSVAGSPFPSEVASIPAASTATFTILFPAASMPGSGFPAVLNITGSYTGGTFSSAGRIVLP